MAAECKHKATCLKKFIHNHEHTHRLHATDISAPGVVWSGRHLQMMRRWCIAMLLMRMLLRWLSSCLILQADDGQAAAALRLKMARHTTKTGCMHSRRPYTRCRAENDPPAVWSASCEEGPCPSARGRLPETPPCLAGWHARWRAADSVGMRHRGWLNDKELSRGVDRLPAITDTLAICHFHPPPPVFLLPQPHAAIYI